MGFALNGLGVLAHTRGDLAAARRLLEEAVAVRRDADPRTLAASLANLGAVLRDAGELAAATACYRESLQRRWERSETFGIAESLAGLAAIAALVGEPRWRRGSGARSTPSPAPPASRLRPISAERR